MQTVCGSDQKGPNPSELDTCDAVGFASMIPVVSPLNNDEARTIDASESNLNFGGDTMRVRPDLKKKKAKCQNTARRRVQNRIQSK